jgi:nitroreductase
MSELAKALSDVPCPAPGDPMPAHAGNPAMLRALLTRRSTVANALGEPGPDTDTLACLLAAAARVPDHGKLAPWRFTVFRGDARARFGEVLADAWARAEPQSAPPERLDFERGRFLRAPVVIAVISSPKESVKIPEWEQRMSAGAVAQTLLIAAGAAGFAAQWITEWYAYDETVQHALGLTAQERVTGFVYIGTAKENPTERARPALADIVSEWRG